MIGNSILHYNILEKLGDGGMGEVYLAEDTKLNRKVALKFLPKKFSQDPEEKKRFMDEARSSSGLDHANICVIYDVNETDEGQLFISMNYCKGENLQDHISKNDLTIKRIIKYISQIARGLEKAHKNNIVHCDIKPSNIIITHDKVAKIVVKRDIKMQCKLMPHLLDLIEYIKHNFFQWMIKPTMRLNKKSRTNTTFIFHSRKL